MLGTVPEGTRVKSIGGHSILYTQNSLSTGTPVVIAALVAVGCPGSPRPLGQQVPDEPGRARKNPEAPG